MHAMSVEMSEYNNAENVICTETSYLKYKFGVCGAKFIS